jgi:hypothetical protein
MSGYPDETRMIVRATDPTPGRNCRCSTPCEGMRHQAFVTDTTRRLLHPTAGAAPPRPRPGRGPHPHRQGHRVRPLPLPTVRHQHGPTRARLWSASTANTPWPNRRSCATGCLTSPPASCAPPDAPGYASPKPGPGRPTSSGLQPPRCFAPPPELTPFIILSTRDMEETGHRAGLVAPLAAVRRDGGGDVGAAGPGRQAGEHGLGLNHVRTSIGVPTNTSNSGKTTPADTLSKSPGLADHADPGVPRSRTLPARSAATQTGPPPIQQMGRSAAIAMLPVGAQLWVVPGRGHPRSNHL